MSKKPEAVTAQAVFTKGNFQLIAKDYDLPVELVQELDTYHDQDKKTRGSLQKLSRVIGKVLFPFWFKVEDGDPSREAEAVHNMKDKVFKFYREQYGEGGTGHSNVSAVWSACRKWAAQEHDAAEKKARAAMMTEEEMKEAAAEERAKKEKAEEGKTLRHLIGDGSYIKNEGKLVAMYKRVALARPCKRLNPELNIVQDKLAEALQAIGYDVKELSKSK